MEIQQPCLESAELGVGMRGHQALDSITKSTGTIDTSRNQAILLLWRDTEHGGRSGQLLLFMQQSGHLPEMSSHVIKDTGPWPRWQFSWPFLQAMVGV